MSVPGSESGRGRVGLFVTCLADLFRPSVAWASVRLLEQAGFEVAVPDRQTCCGQPAYNAGDLPTARRVARGILDAFEPFDYVVVPSGSCAGMLRLHLGRLFASEPETAARAEQLARRTHELTGFLVDVAGWTGVAATFPHRVTYHDSCSSLREMAVRDQPRTLMTQVQGLELVELQDRDVCCGFGGTFCVKYSDISTKMVSDKTAAVAATGAETVLAGDLGCLLNIAGRLAREGRPVACRHVAEVLAGMTDTDPIVPVGS